VYAADIKLLGYAFDNSNVHQLIAARNAKLSWRREWLFVGAGI
jgi:hypothetical protein